MRAVCTEDEFELEKDGIDVATKQKKLVVDEVMIILQPDFTELRWIP